MGFNLKKIVKNPVNWVAAAAAPFTAGASLAFMQDDKGNDFLGELTGANSAKEANRRNIEAQQAINDQNIAMQRETNETSINLANTAHQREVADLHAAGLNPILSNGGSGAITPSLGTAVAQAPQIQNELPGGYLAQAGQVANIAGLAAGAQQAVSAGKLSEAQAQVAQTENQYMPAMKKAEIAAQYANAGNARAQADYTNVMKDVDKELKKAETNKIDKETPYGGKTITTIKDIFGLINNNPISARKDKITNQLMSFIK